MSRSSRLAGASILGLALAACGGSSVGSAPESAPATEATQSAGATPDVAARIGDRAITVDEVDQAAMARNLQQFQALYDARRQTLEQMIFETLLEREAKERGTTTLELLNTEINAKVKEVSDADVKAFFDQNRSRMGNRTLEQMTPAIRDFLVNRQRQERRDTLLNELKRKNGVRIVLEPPRVHVEVAQNDPSRGPAAAAVEIIEFADFE